MIQDFFPDIDAKEAAGYVGLLSLANMSGRFIWSSTSDVIGRKPIYMGYLGIGAILYFVLASSGTAGIALFVAVTAVILSFYGGGFATVPAYLKDLFGGLEVGAIHGRLLTAWSAAGIAGPTDRQPGRRLPGGSRQGGRGPLHALALHHGRRPGRRLRREPPDPARGRALSRAQGGGDAAGGRQRSRNSPTEPEEADDEHERTTRQTPAAARSYPRSSSGSSWPAACSTASCRPPRRSPRCSAADAPGRCYAPPCQPGSEFGGPHADEVRPPHRAAGP